MKTTHIIKGEFASIKALEIKDELLKLSETENHQVDLDLSEVTHADLGAVNALMMSYNALRKNNGELNIKMKKAGEMDELLHLTKFKKFLSIQYI